MKVNKYVLIALGVAVVIGLYTVFTSGGPKKVAPVATPTLDLPRAEARPEPELRLAEPKPVPPSVTDAKWDRDPFLLPRFMTEKKQEKKPPLKLTAILEGSSGRVAIIDNEVVAKGDVIGGERVQEIGKDRVVLVQDKSKRVISMQETP